MRVGNKKEEEHVANSKIILIFAASQTHNTHIIL